MEALFAFLLEIRDKLSETHNAVKQIRSIRRQVEEWTARTEGQATGQPVAKAAEEIKEKLAAIEGELVQSSGTIANRPAEVPRKVERQIGRASLLGNQLR